MLSSYYLPTGLVNGEVLIREEGEGDRRRFFVNTRFKEHIPAPMPINFTFFLRSGSFWMECADSLIPGASL